MSSLKDSRPVIAIDGRWALARPEHPLGRYSYHLITELAFLSRPYDLYVYGDLSADPETVKRWRFLLPVDLLITPNRVTWEQMAFPQASGSAALVHAMDVPPLVSRRPRVVTVMAAPGREGPAGAFPARLADAYRRQMMAWTLPRAALVMTADDATRDQLVARFGVRPDRVRVIPGTPRPEEPMAPSLKALAIAAVIGHSHLPAALEAVDQLPPAVALWLGCGGSASWSDIERALARHHLAGRTAVVDVGDQDEWRQRLRKAQVFLYLPDGPTDPAVMLEAMMLGTPVVASRNPLAADVLGDAGLLVDVPSGDNLLPALSQLLAHPELQQTFIEKGQVRAQKQFWRNAAKRTHEAYLEVLAARGIL
ncbi:MAG: glycosyltransferase [Firmicutes bacterium]|nr:glycosyltransferase [Bacillota bacterium]